MKIVFKRNSIFLLLVVLLFVINNLNAQDDKYPEVNITSPNAASLAKYVDYPVNLYAGVPDITIPIYTVQEGALQLPVSLSYHAAGLKIQETASWVGAGWSLNAGGVITRTVKGLPDEKVGWENFSFYSHFGYSNYFMDVNNKTDYNSLLSGHKDGEPDLFFFNFNGYSGKFMFRENQEPMLLPDSDLKIAPLFKSGSNSYYQIDYLQGFIITTPDGTKYYFGVTPEVGDVDPIEKGASTIYDPTPELKPVYDKVISSWYLYKIESADSKFNITIKYRSENYSYHNYITSPCAPNCSSIALTKSTIFGVTPSEILFTNGTVTFVPASTAREDLGDSYTGMGESGNVEAKALDLIKIMSNQSTHCQAFKFNTSYFVNNSSLPYPINEKGNFVADKKRLKLNSIQELDCTGNVTKPPFSFTYYDEDKVARSLTYSQDHWGFNNGVETNFDLIPKVFVSNGDVPYASDSDNREAGWPAMRAGTLRSISYPTGGGVEYTYEPNEVVTKQCQFEKTDVTQTVFHAGMGTYSAEFGQVYTLTLQEPAQFYYRVSSNGGGSGQFYVDHNVISSVSAYGSSEDYITFPAGTYSLRAYANADATSGTGVLVYLYKTTSTCIDIPKMVGGLRVKRIEQYGVGGSKRTMKDFKYDQAYLYSIPTYIYKVKNELLSTGILLVGFSPNGCPEYSSGKYTVYTSASSILPLQTTQGYHIGYGKVKEVLPDGSYSINEFQGSLALPSNWLTLQDVCVRSVNEFTCTKNDPVYPGAPLQFDYKRGNLTAKSFYDQAGKKLTESFYTQEYQYDNVGIFGVVTKRYQTGTVLPNHYDFRTAKLIKSKERIRQYNPDNVLEYQETEVVTEIGSPYHNMPTRKTETVNTGLVERLYRYVPDLTGCNYECPTCESDYLTAAYEAERVYLQNKDDCNVVCGPRSFVGCDNNYVNQLDDCGPGDDQVLRKAACKVCAWTDFQYRLNELRKTYTNCIKACKANSESCITAGKSSTNADKKSLFTLEEINQISTPIETSIWSGGKLLGASNYYFKASSTDLMDIKLKNVYTIPIGDPQTDLIPVTIDNSGFVKDPKYSQLPEINITYDQGNIVELVGRDGVSTSYVWGYGNTMPLAKAVGVSYSVLKAAYTADPVNFRNNSTLAGALITTYQFDPVVGMVSITDPNGQKQSYEYDAVGRLIKIKDHDGKVLEQIEYRYQF